MSHPKHSAFVQSQKQQNGLGLFSRQTIQHHSNPSLCPDNWCWRSWTELVIWRRPATPSRTNSNNSKKKKRKSVFFVTGNWNVKVGSQEIPRITVKFGLGVQNEAGQRLTEFCQEKILVRAHTLFQQYRRQFYTWTSTNGQYQNQIDYIICSWRWRRFLQSAKTRPGTDYGSVYSSTPCCKPGLNWRK